MSLKPYLYSKNQDIFDPIFNEAGITTDKQKKCANIILTNLHQRDDIEFLSDKDWYSKKYLYHLYDFTYTPVKAVIEKLELHSFIKKKSDIKKKSIKKKSDIKTTTGANAMAILVPLPKLKNILDTLKLDIVFRGVAAFTKEPIKFETIKKIKDGKEYKEQKKVYIKISEKNDSPYYEVKKIPARHIAIENLLKKYNRKINDVIFTLDHPQGTFNKEEVTKQKKFYDSKLRYLRSIFQWKFEICGRCYGAFWENMKKEVRSGLKMDGESLIDFDFVSCYPAILYKLANEQLPENPYYYEKDTSEREIAKKLFMTLMSIEKENKTDAQLIHQIWFSFNEKRKKEEVNKSELEPIINNLVSLHKPIEHLLFNREQFYKTQFIESELIRSVLKHCLNKGVCFLPIHDGGLCKKSDENIVEQAFLNIKNEKGYDYTKNLL